MRNAYECEERFGRDGQCVERKRLVGPCVPWMIVALAAIIAGQAFIPLSFWQIFKAAP